MKVITSVKNEYIIKLQKLSNKKERTNQQLFIVEGLHLVEESKDRLVAVLSTDEKLLKKYSCDTYLVTDEIIKKLSNTVTPQNILGVVKMLDHSINLLDDIMKNKKVKILMLDNVNDPGNLGTIIRTAAGLGMSCIIMSEDTVDIYNDKVLRSTQGSLYKLPIIKTDLEKAIKLLKNNNFKCYGTSLKNAKAVNEVDKSDKFVIIVGNEANGVRDNILSLTDYNIVLPMKHNVESLNVSVAASIIMYEFIREELFKK